MNWINHSPYRAGVLVALSVCLAFLTFVSGSSAKPNPKVKWTSSTGATAGQPIAFSWTSDRVGNAKLVVQRPVGTKRVWKTALKLPGRSGSAQLPGQSIGKYRYRLAALDRDRVIASQTVTVRVYGEVPFSTLLSRSESDGVLSTMTTSFPYVNRVLLNGEQSLTAFSVKENNCSSVHVSFVPSEEQQIPAEQHFWTASSGTITVTQESRDPVSATAPFNGVGSVDAQLVPGQTWSVVATSHIADPKFLHIYYNGYAICDSAEPLA